MISYKDELQHHGILGMHWGVRRHQNKDGSLTSAGKKRYATGEKSVKESKELSLSENASKIVKESKDCLPFSASYSLIKNRYNEPGFKTRVTKAADLALKALAKEGRISADAVGDNSWRYWVLYEDQTLGLGMVADMINQGYSAKDVSNFIDRIEKSKKELRDLEYAGKLNNYTIGVLFDVSEGNYNGKLQYFAKLCEEAKNDLRHSDIMTFIDSHKKKEV